VKRKAEARNIKNGGRLPSVEKKFMSKKKTSLEGNKGTTQETKLRAAESNFVSSGERRKEKSQSTRDLG